MDSKKYINYHCHSYMSNIIIADSPVSPLDYINRIKELGHTTYVSTEHGISFNWVEKYLLCKKHNIKFVYGVESYILYNDKVYHIMFVAKNKNGMFQINRMISDAVYNNFKYKRPRVDLDLIKRYINPLDVICTSACIAGILKEPTLILCKELINIFKDNFYLEVAYHKHKTQIELNEKAKIISQKTGCKLIAGNDSHYIYPEQKVLRDELLASRRIVYTDEEDDESEFYMDYPSYDVMYDRFKEQGIWTDDEINSIIDITNMIEEFEDIEFSRDWKVPTLYPELNKKERQQLLIDLAYKYWNNYKINIPESQYDIYKEEIKKELQEWIKCDMEDYLLTASGLVKRGVELGGIVTMSGRGSASSYITTTLFGLSTIDRIQSHTPLLPERFMTADRIIAAHSTPDYDINVYNREYFIQAQDELLGQNSNYQMCAYGTLKEKSAFRMLCKVKPEISMDDQLYITSQIEKFEREYKYSSEEDRELMKVDDYISDERMLSIYKQAENFLGTVVDIKGSPCSWAISNDNLMEIFGLCKAPNGDVLLNIEGKYIEDFGYLKMDWLIVDAVGIINAVYKEIGIPIPTSNELSWIVKDDKKTWDIYAKGITCCVNQVEGAKTRSRCMAYKPKTIEELSAFIASIRPGFISNYSKFEKREKFEYGIKEIDKLLQGKFLDNSWLLYQEQIMMILSYCGFERKETYDILKAISKKKEHVILSAKDKFFEKMEALNVPYNTISSLWQIIIDSSAYSFNASHSLSMAHDSVWIAYAKAHYSQQTYVALINYFTEKRDMTKVRTLRQEAENYFNIKVIPRKFGQNNSKINIQNNCIYQSLASVKGINSSIADKINTINNKHYNTFDLYCKLKEIGLDKTQIETLAKISYFDDVIGILWLAENYKEIKQLKKDKLPMIANEYNLDCDESIISMMLLKSASKETVKMIQFEDQQTVIRLLFNYIKRDEINPLKKAYWEIDLIGEVLDDTEYDYYKIEKYNEKKGSILLKNIVDNMLYWFMYKKDVYLQQNDIVAIKHGAVKYGNKGLGVISQIIDLTQLFKRR